MFWSSVSFQHFLACEDLREKVSNDYYVYMFLVIWFAVVSLFTTAQFIQVTAQRELA